ncbi:MAG: ABC transporter permease [Acidimicrobiales bacterium]
MTRIAVREETTSVPAGDVLRLGMVRARLELKQFFRSKEAAFFGFAFPVMLLVLFSSIFGSGTVDGTGVRYANVLLAGLMAAGIMSVAFTTLAISIAMERDDGTLKRLWITPMPRASYFVGKVLFVLVTAFAETVVLIVVAVAFYGLELPNDLGRWITFAWVFVLGVSASTVLGIAVSSVPRSGRAAVSVVQPPFIALQFISGVYVDWTSLPEGLRIAASVFPLKWMAQGFRSVFLPDSFLAVEPGGSWQHPAAAVVLGLWCLGGLALCAKTFRWNVRDGH